MSSRGIIPDAAYGGQIVNVLPGPAGVTNAYVPPSSFTVSIPLTFYGASCSANRFDPQQLNAFESEMISLAATMAPNGTWNASTVTNLSAAFQMWSSTFTGGVSLAPDSDYPSLAADNTHAATPAYVTAAINAAGGTSLVKAQAAQYPAQIANDTEITTPAFVRAAINGALAPSSVYPSDGSDNAKAATPAYVTAAITAATASIEATVEALIPSITPSGSFPSASNTTAATPAYVAAAVAGAGLTVANQAAYPEPTNDTAVTTPKYVNSAIQAATATIEALIPLLAPSSSYPDASDNTKAATPAYVAAAISASGAIPVLAPASAYPDNTDDTKAATPAYVHAAAVAAISTAEAAIPALAIASTYPDNSDDAKSATPAYVHAAAVAAIATAEAAIPALAIASTYPDNSDDAKSATPAYVHAAAVAAIATAEAAIPVLSTSSSYPTDVASNVKAATPAYVAAAIAAGSGTSSLAADSDVAIVSPTNKQVLEYNSGTSKWNNANVPFDICVSITGTMTASEIVLQFVFPYAAQFASGLGTSYAKASVGATGTPQITINKNGSAIGTINWAASATTATFTFASAVSFAAGDILQLVAPSSADATLANIGITLDGTKI